MKIQNGNKEDPIRPLEEIRAPMAAEKQSRGFIAVDIETTGAFMSNDKIGAQY